MTEEIKDQVAPVEEKVISSDETKSDKSTKTERSITDIYLERKIKKRKITLISILSVALALVITIITMGCVKVDLRPNFMEAPAYVTIVGENETKNFDNEDEVYKTFENIYNDMFTTSFLSALFTGKLGGYEIEESITRWYTNDREENFSSTITEALGSNYVKFYYDQPMKFYYSNGKDYQSIYSSRYSLTYQEVYFAITEEDATQDFTFYFKVYGNSGVSPQKATITKISLRANTAQLFEEFLGK